MEIINQWMDGLNDFKIHTLKKDKDLKKYHYNLELIDQEIDLSKSILDIFYDHIKDKKTSKVEMLYSGGLDSEFVLSCLRLLKIPTIAITLRLMFKGCLMNTHDLYYSEKFCRENKITQKFIDLDVVKFYESEYLNYLKPYNINYFHVASHFYMIEKCDYFPIIGGNHTWPWTSNQKILSPIRYQNNMHDKFMRDNNINGIGDMILYSFESNYLVTKTHIDLFKNDKTNQYGGNADKIIITKKHLYERLIPDIRLTPRIRTYGWDNILPVYFNKQKHELMLNSMFGSVVSSITWGKKIAEILDGYPGTNDKHF